MTDQYMYPPAQMSLVTLSFPPTQSFLFSSTRTNHLKIPHGSSLFLWSELFVNLASSKHSPLHTPPIANTAKSGIKEVVDINKQRPGTESIYANGLQNGK
jgi:hypothetical protein